jgi:hypothetical protein
VRRHGQSRGLLGLSMHCLEILSDCAKKSWRFVSHIRTPSPSQEATDSSIMPKRKRKCSPNSPSTSNLQRRRARSRSSAAGDSQFEEVTLAMSRASISRRAVDHPVSTARLERAACAADQDPCSIDVWNQRISCLLNSPAGNLEATAQEAADDLAADLRFRHPPNLGPPFG